ncbi:MAG: polysaccharide biosynthesis C-terminal domain-containing protein [Burkholderiales bacterium]|nr:polysaccharide biosynthesis C-terminal domain-containing protein [Burkholderiales bacterium]
MSLHRPVILVFSADLASKILLGLTWLLLIRYLPPEEFALLTLATSVATVASQMLGSSINRIYILDSSSTSNGGPGPLVLFQAGALLLLGIAGLPFSGALPGTAYMLTVLLALGMLLSDFGKTMYQKQLKFSAFSFIELARSAVVSAALIVLLMQFGAGIRAWQVIAVQAAALGMLSLIVISRHLDLRETLDLRRGIDLLRPVFGNGHGYLFAYFFALAFFSQVDIFLIKVLSDQETLASFGSAARYYQLLSLALGAVHAVFLPTMQHLATRQALDEFFGRHFRMLLVFAPVVGVCALAAPWVLPWIDLGRYPDAVPTFQILCLSVIISFAFSPHVNLVFTHRRFRFLLLLIVVALVVNIGLGLMLIPTYGGQGAAVATLIASACVTVPIYILSRRLRQPPAGIADVGSNGHGL